MKVFNMRWALLLAIAAALVVAGCGSSDSDSTAESTSPPESTESETSSSASEASAEVAKFQVAPAELPGITPLTKLPPPGSTLAYMQCSVLQCTDVGNQLDAAAPLLGFKIKKYDTGATPESISAAFDRAVQDKSAGVLVPAIPSVLYKKQLAEFKAAGIPVVAWTVPEEPGNGLAKVLLDTATYERNGKLLADWVVADSNGEANTVFFNVPDFPALTTMQESFEATYKELCSGCGYGSASAPPTAIGKELPGQVVSYVQANPDTNYVVLAFGSMVLGVPEALKAAGLSEQVKLVSQAGLNLNFEYIEDGGQAVDLTLSHENLAYAAVDSMARALTGQSVAETSPELPGIFLTQENLDFDPKSNTTWPMPDSYKQQYEAAWGGN